MALSKPLRFEDHPRIRGEHQSPSCLTSPRTGSSPHTRGARKSTAHPTPACRIIPAYAGSTRRRRAPSGRLEDHPRIRGEHSRLLTCRLILLWIIPAYAGSTVQARRRSFGQRDHPRIRGEHRLDIPWPQAMQGSSPHTRGALQFREFVGVAEGIIPAYAGSTEDPHPRGSGVQDHPRIRGEHARPRVTSRGTDGSSPHTRGALPERHCFRGESGIIPAYAGSTCE